VNTFKNAYVNSNRENNWYRKTIIL
jgi:hypothetical protein